MKKIILFAALMCSLTFQAQKAVVRDVKSLTAKEAVFLPFSVLTPVSSFADKSYESVVRDASLAVIKTDVVNDIVANKYPTIEVSVPYHNQTITVDLFRVDLLAEGFHLDTNLQTNLPYNPGAFYRGMVKGDDNSLVSFSFYNGEINAIISNSELSNLVIGKLHRPGNTKDYILYEDQKMLVTQDFNCHTDDKNVKGDLSSHRSADTSSPQTTKCISMYFEMDYNIYQSNGSDVYANANWMMGLFNNMATLYANETVNTALKTIYMWTTPDPYTGSSSSDYRDQFGNVRPNFDGDVGQLIGIDPGGLGGVAASIGGICSSYDYSYADIDPTYAEVPTYSWTAQVVTHENGHVFGSRHTHACVWNGNNTCIDGCAGYQEGECAIGPIPSASAKGTIMSYCHLVSGVGISFANGFGPQPGAAVVNFVNGSSCLSTNCSGACVNRVSNIQVQALSSTSIKVLWADTNGTSQWEVSVSEADSGFDFSELVNVMNYTATNLVAGTQYRVKVRPICNGFLYTDFKEYLFTMGNLGVTDNKTLDFAYYPNPTHNMVTINAKSTIDELQVYNIEGRLLLRKTVNAADTTVDLSAFAAGTYFIKLQSASGEANFKVLKM